MLKKWKELSTKEENHEYWNQLFIYSFEMRSEEALI
jgi:hypothetical protein